jgi:hypothetical protein
MVVCSTRWEWVIRRVNWTVSVLLSVTYRAAFAPHRLLRCCSGSSDRMGLTEVNPAEMVNKSRPLQTKT